MLNRHPPVSSEVTYERTVRVNYLPKNFIFGEGSITYLENILNCRKLGILKKLAQQGSSQLVTQLGIIRSLTRDFQLLFLSHINFLHGHEWYRDILYTNILYTLQSLYVTKFILHKIHTVTKFIQTLFIR
jgi:hypothetical protein